VTETVPSAAQRDYTQKARRLSQQMRNAPREAVGLAKKTSNLFRDRSAQGKRLLEVRDFDQVIDIDIAGGWIEVEGMAPYETVVEQALARGVMPAVVPELKTITVGGAAAGVAIESSSFKYGLMHETIEEMDVLLSDGNILTCRADNDHRDLFFGLPNSYGTLGYALRLKILAIPVKPYVALQHRAFTDAGGFFDALAIACDSDADFVDGVVFDRNRLFLTTARFTGEAPYLSDYTYRHIYYRSIAERSADFLSTRDYIWRWDTDWFWCSKNLGAQNPLMRRLLGPGRLNSRTYTRIMRWNSRWRFTQRIEKLTGRHSEGVIQDVDIPLDNAEEFLEFLLREIGIKPIWCCPVRKRDPDRRYALYPMDADRLYVNFGFWDRAATARGTPPGHLNRKVEKKVGALEGIKSLYSDSYYPPEEFWSIYNGGAYRRLKAKYDPNSRLRDLYRKCVLKE